MARPILDSARITSSVPIRNRHVIASRSADGATVAIEVALQVEGWKALPRRLFGARNSRRYELDRMGTEVYDSIDDRKSFQTLVEEFGARHKLTYFEARALLMQYLQMLMRRGIVVIGIKE